MLTYQLTKEISNATIRNISNKRIKEESPSHRIKQCLLDLIHFEMLVANTLLVNPHAGNGQNAIFLV